MRFVGVLLLVGVVQGLGFSAKAAVRSGEEAEAGGWLYKEKVYYQEFRGHDSNDVFLQNGEQLYVDMEWSVAESWSVGRPFFLAYKPATGAVLLDSKSGRVIPILHGLKNHPIDILLRNENPENTMAIVQAYVKAEQLWDKELNRVYKRLLAGKSPRAFTKEEKAGLVRSQRQWIKFRDAQRRVISIVFGKRSGTIQSIHHAAHVMEVTRTQALRLSSYLLPGHYY